MSKFARNSDPDTSKAAGSANVTFRKSQKNLLLVAHGSAFDHDPSYCGFTADEAWIAAGGKVPSLSCYWHRHGELESAGLLRAIPIKRKGNAGKDQRVLALTMDGYKEYARLAYGAA